MLLLIIFILLILGGITLYILDDKCKIDLNNGLYIFIFLVMLIASCGVILITGHAIGRNLEMYKTGLDAKYEQLQQNKNNDYLIQDIVEWNTDLAFNKKYNDNIWIGITIPEYYSDYDYITPDK